MKEVNEELNGISSYFKDQAENNHRKMKIFDEIMELSGFSKQEIIDVGEYILKDTNKVDTFFALPKVFGGLMWTNNFLKQLHIGKHLIFKMKMVFELSF